MHTLTFKGFYSSGLGEQVLIVGHHLCIKNVQELGTTQDQGNHHLFGFLMILCKASTVLLPCTTCEYSSLSSAAIPLASFWRVSPTIWHWMVVVANVLASKSSRRRGCSEAAEETFICKNFQSQIITFHCKSTYRQITDFNITDSTCSVATLYSKA